jgi:hypothetical protein
LRQLGNLFPRRSKKASTGSTLLRREEQLHLTFSSEESRQLILIWASLVFQGAEQNSRAFLQAQDIGMIQRENPADSKSPAPIRDQACSAPFGFETEQSADLLSEAGGGYCLLIPLKRGFCVTGNIFLVNSRKDLSPV